MRQLSSLHPRFVRCLLGALGALGATVMVAACGSVAVDDAKGKPPSGAQMCVRAEPWRAADGSSKACEHEFCPPKTVSTSIATGQGESVPCFTYEAETCSQKASEGGFFYQYEVDGFKIELGFDPALGGDFTEAGIRKNFSFFTIEQLPLGEPVAKDLTINLIQSFYGLTQFEEFKFEDGRLSGRLRFDITQASYNLYSVDPDCLQGDIILYCTCAFGGFSIPAVVDFDLALAPILAE